MRTVPGSSNYDTVQQSSTLGDMGPSRVQHQGVEEIQMTDYEEKNKGGNMYLLPYVLLQYFQSLIRRVNCR